ncbi:hypothetical protein P9112_009675 [Eukaryota sp. TZLM1-RC]
MESDLTFRIEDVLLRDELNEGSDQANTCLLYLRGHCLRGSNCPFRHWRPPEKETVCKHWMRGLCKKGEYCEYLHQLDMDRMPECWFYYTYGECHNQECSFRHINPEEKMSDCPYYARGFCKNGPRCTYRHVRRQPCELYLAGFCPRGNKCENGHPKFEMVRAAPEAPTTDFGSGNSKRISCHICKGPHKANVCPDKQKHHRTGPIVCFKCGIPGHLANKCTTRQGRGWHQNR